MGLKPMNCPAHVQIYKRELRSYRDLPIRYAEQGLVHRHEPSGTLHGLLRVRHITQDDAHVFCTEEQIEEEVMRCLDFGFFIYEQFGLRAAARAVDAAGEARRHRGDVGQGRGGAAQRTLEDNGLEYELNEGDGAFYGPKIDLHMTDAIGRSWQLGTVQLDYYMPEQFELAYTGADNAEHRPVMIHRALMGSFERFIGILIEHYAGEFPLWLAPVQARRAADRRPPRRVRARGGRASCATPGMRAEVDERTESIGKKIREAELRKVPYMLVVGDPEQEAGDGRRAPPPRGRPGRGAGRGVRRARSRRDRGQALTSHANDVADTSPRFDGRPEASPSADPAQVRSAPPGARRDTHQRAHPRAPGAPDRRGRQPDRRRRHASRRCATPRSATSTSSRWPPTPARRSAACSTTRSTSTSRSRRPRPRAATRSRSTSARSSCGRRSRPTTTRPRRTTSSASSRATTA